MFLLTLLFTSWTPSWGNLVSDQPPSEALNEDEFPILISSHTSSVRSRPVLARAAQPFYLDHITQVQPTQDKSNTSHRPLPSPSGVSVLVRREPVLPATLASYPVHAQHVLGIPWVPLDSPISLHQTAAPLSKFPTPLTPPQGHGPPSRLHVAVLPSGPAGCSSQSDAGASLLTLTQLLSTRLGREGPPYTNLQQPRGFFQGQNSSQDKPVKII